MYVTILPESNYVDNVDKYVDKKFYKYFEKSVDICKYICYNIYRVKEEKQITRKEIAAMTDNKITPYMEHDIIMLMRETGDEQLDSVILDEVYNIDGVVLRKLLHMARLYGQLDGMKKMQNIYEGRTK